MEKLMLGLSTTGVGMLVVFSGLVILIVCISCMTMFTGRSKPAKSAPVKAAPAPAPAPAPASAAEPEAEEDDLSVVAAITAAIAVLWQEEGHDSGFVVRRVRRVANASARARAAREEQIYSHF
ncbi:MAG: OadG family protein [Clostridia bacterium]|nr:OadG family protein [Clostridia bacterium]